MWSISQLVCNLKVASGIAASLITRTDSVVFFRFDKTRLPHEISSIIKALISASQQFVRKMIYIEDSTQNYMGSIAHIELCAQWL